MPFGRAFYEGYAARAGFVLVPASSAPDGSAIGRFAPARSWTLDATLLLARSGAGTDRLAFGVAAAARFRTEAVLGWGARLSYDVAPHAWQGASTVHRLAAVGLAEARWPGALAPYVDAGAGWLFTLLLGRVQQGDALGLTGHTAAGLVWDGPVRLRAAFLLDLDWVRVDASRTLSLVPGGEVGVSF